jgi:UrcA family protein
MNITTPFLTANSCICAAAVAACALLSGPIHANEPTVAVSISVSTAGLDLNQATDARTMYGRLTDAARVVCGRGQRVDLRPVANISDCIDSALGDAVRSVNRSQLTMIFLQTHSLQDAANRGIEVPVLVAAK